MADVPITAVEVTPAGAAPASASSITTSDLGLVAKNDGQVFLLIANASGGARAVTFLIRTPAEGVKNPAWDPSAANPSISVPNSASRVVGPFPVNLFGRTLQVDTDGTVTVQAFRFHKAGDAHAQRWQ